MIIGVSGILFEWYSPGLFIPGVVGMISLGMACLSIQSFSISKTAWPLFAFVVLVSLLVFGFVMKKVVVALQAPVVTGREGLIHQIGVAKSGLDPKGTIFVQGEVWDAVSEEPVSANEEVVVAGVEGLVLKVKRL